MAVWMVEEQGTADGLADVGGARGRVILQGNVESAQGGLSGPSPGSALLQEGAHLRP